MGILVCGWCQAICSQSKVLIKTFPRWLPHTPFLLMYLSMYWKAFIRYSLNLKGNSHPAPKPYGWPAHPTIIWLVYLNGHDHQKKVRAIGWIPNCHATHKMCWVNPVDTLLWWPNIHQTTRYVSVWNTLWVHSSVREITKCSSTFSATNISSKIVWLLQLHDTMQYCYQIQ